MLHILYADESGHPKDPNLQFFTLAGVSVFAPEMRRISNSLDNIAARFNPENPQAVELHGSPMRARKGLWRDFPYDLRDRAIQDALRVLGKFPNTSAFAVAADIREIKNPTEFCFMQLASRFDRYLAEQDGEQQGMMFCDRLVKEWALQALTARYRESGHEWGQIQNFAEVPAFIDSRASRLIQLADLVAFAVGRKLNNNDETYFNIIASRFAQNNKKLQNYQIFPRPNAE